MTTSYSRASRSRKLSALVFDLDGVLLDTGLLIRRAFAESYRRVIGDGEPPIAEYMSHMGDSFPNIMKSMGLPSDMWDAFKAASAANLDLAAVFPGINTLLEQVARAGVRMGILTGKDLDRTGEILRHFGLSDYFDVVVTPEVVPHPKPHPDGLYFALARLRAPKLDALYVGDAVNDMLCAKRAGVTSVAALWGAQVSTDAVVGLADYAVNSPATLIELLRHHFGL